MNRTWVYIVAGAALVAGGVALLSHHRGAPGGSDDPITEAQRMLDRAQATISDIEAGLRSSRGASPQPA